MSESWRKPIGSEWEAYDPYDRHWNRDKVSFRRVSWRRVEVRYPFCLWEYWGMSQAYARLLTFLGTALILGILTLYSVTYEEPPTRAEIATERCIALADGRAWERFSIKVGRGATTAYGHMCHVFETDGTVTEYRVG